MKYFAVLLLLVASVSFGQSSHILQVDDGLGNFATITGPGSGGNLNFTLPASAGTLLTTSSASNAFWALGGNSSPSSNLLGTVTADPINFITGSGGPNTRMTIAANGDVTVVTTNLNIGGVTYVWPNAQGAANSVLGNNGSGTLSWVTSVAPSGTAGGDLSGTYPNPTVSKINGNTIPANAAGVLTNNGTGTLTWAAGGGGTPAGANTEVQFNNSGAFGSSSNFTFVSGTALTSTNTNLVLANNNNTATQLRLQEPSGSGANVTTFKAQAQAADVNYILPAAQASAANQVLTNNGSGTLSWAAPTVSATNFNYTHITSANSPYSAANTDVIIGVTTAGGAVTVNLPLTSNVGAGYIIIIKDEGNNAAVNNITINRSGTDNLEFGTSLTLNISKGRRMFYSDGAGNWFQLF